LLEVELLGILSGFNVKEALCPGFECSKYGLAIPAESISTFCNFIILIKMKADERGIKQHISMEA